MSKINYLIKTLSKTNRKDFENYVINRLYNELNDLDIKPRSQKYVKNKENNKYYLIDLYFPQFNLGIECDEPHHKKQMEKDELRYEDIINNLEGYHEERILQEDNTIEDINKRITEVVNIIKKKKKEKKKAKDFEEWIEITPEEYFKDKQYINIKDEIGFLTIEEVYKVIFREEKKSSGHGCFDIANDKNYKVWFPHITTEEKSYKGWYNILSDDKNEIKEYNEKDKDKIKLNNIRLEETTEKRVVFMQIKDRFTDEKKYKFLGIFKKYISTNNSFCVYKKVSDKFKIIKQ